MLAEQIQKAKERELIAALDRGEALIAETLADLCTAPDPAPGDVELLAPG